jgi:hypothetical protein
MPAGWHPVAVPFLCRVSRFSLALNVPASWPSCPAEADNSTGSGTYSDEWLSFGGSPRLQPGEQRVFCAAKQTAP